MAGDEDRYVARTPSDDGSEGKMIETDPLGKLREMVAEKLDLRGDTVDVAASSRAALAWMWTMVRS